jgi:hypothetical protein
MTAELATRPAAAPRSLFLGVADDAPNAEAEAEAEEEEEEAEAEAEEDGAGEEGGEAKGEKAAKGEGAPPAPAATDCRDRRCCCCWYSSSSRLQTGEVPAPPGPMPAAATSERCVT